MRLGRLLITVGGVCSLSGLSLATTLSDLRGTNASALSVGALALQQILSQRAEVQAERVQSPFVFVESGGGAIWVTAWMGAKGLGQTPRERCKNVLQDLRSMLGLENTGAMTDALRMNLNALVLAANGTASTDALATQLADLLKVRGTVYLPPRAGVCQDKAGGGDLSFSPDDAGWDKVLP